MLKVSIGRFPQVPCKPIRLIRNYLVSLSYTSLSIYLAVMLFLAAIWEARLLALVKVKLLV